MKEVYVFNDWTSVSQFKNSYNESIKAECSVICNCGCIHGYVLTVYNKNTNEILYRVNINDGRAGVWSISTEEAIQLMNDVGFFCRYESSPFVPTNYHKNILSSLSNLGYCYIHRSIRPLNVTVYREVKENIDPRTTPGDSLREVISSFNYNDWSDLPLGLCLSINKLLEVIE